MAMWGWAVALLGVCAAAAATAPELRAQRPPPDTTPTHTRTRTRTQGHPASSAPPLPAGFLRLHPADYEALLTDDAGNHLAWAEATIPFFDCPDAEVRAAYCYRWTSYKKHIFAYPDVGHVVTEFLPKVPWSGKYNTIPCAAGHHVMEARWMRDETVLNDYLRFWFRGGGSPRRYTFWAAHAAYHRYLVNLNASFVVDLLPDLVANAVAWNSTHLTAVNGTACFWQSDGADGGEVSIGGSGCRPTINSVMAAEAAAIVSLAQLAESHPPPSGDPSFSPWNSGRFCCASGDCARPGFIVNGAAASRAACQAMCLGHNSTSGGTACAFYTYYESGCCQLSANCSTTAPAVDTDCTTYALRKGPADWTPVVRRFTALRGQMVDFITQRLWNPATGAFATIPAPRPAGARDVMRRGGSSADGPHSGLQCPPSWPAGKPVGVRELLGFTPWYFSALPAASAPTAFEAMWANVSTDTSRFASAWGLRTAERSAPCYNYSGTWQDHECNWNGPSWPYETSRVLSGMANLLSDYPAQTAVSARDFFSLFLQYTHQHTRSHPTNGTTPWIGEDIHPDLGYWIARWILYRKGDSLRNRGHNYNHSTFVDLVLSCLMGLRPAAGNTLTINPLVPSGVWPWFCVDHLLYHGHDLTIVWDSDGSKYSKGSGLQVFADGHLLGSSPTLGKLVVTLPAAV